MEKKKKKINQQQLGRNQNQIKSSRVKNRPVLPKHDKPKSTPEERLSDLENTLDLNIQILKTFYQSSKKDQSLITNQSTLIDAIDKIKKQYLNKKNLFNQLKERKSKSLIELQIYAEKKRKIEEIKDMYLNKIEENEEGLNGKEEHIKKVQKRLMEVEVYIHKLTLNLPDENRRKYYQDFTIGDFLDVNNDLARQKDLLTKNVDQIKNDLQATIDENKMLSIKNGEENSKNDENEIKNNDNKKQNEEKLKKLTEKYENQIKYAITRKNLLKNAIESLNIHLNCRNINQLIKKSNKSINIINNKEENIKDDKNVIFKKIDIAKKKINERNSGRNQIEAEESLNKRANNNDDLNNRLNSFLDFSVLNNKEEENLSREKFGVIKSSIWDVSAINGDGISFIEKKE